jgi:hypothetical protein
LSKNIFWGYQNWNLEIHQLKIKGTTRILKNY